jgi:hypothetical protein
VTAGRHRVGGERPDRRARLLLRCYPRWWRDRYGDEFAELLTDDMAERPHSWRRVADVVRAALAARAAGSGLVGCALPRPRRAGACLSSLAVAVMGTLVLTAALWSQLATTARWSTPRPAVAGAATVIGWCAVALVAATAAAAVPLLGAARAQWRRAALRRPALVALAGGAVLVAWAHHFANGWPGTGGHGGPGPGGVAAFAWAATLWVTSYWAHPGALAAFPATEVAWMAASPLALAALVGGSAAGLRRLELSPRVLAWEARLARALCVVLAALVGACAVWVAGRGSIDGNSPVGAIDVAAALLLLLALAVALRATGRVARTLPAVD